MEITTVNIGIPAYNEAANIRRLLSQVAEQKEDGFVIKKIFVISDGSSDATVNEAEKINDPRVFIVNHLDRKGNAVRFQELLAISDSDILVQLDADINLQGNEIVSKIVKSIKAGADLVFPRIQPLSPQTFVEKLAFFGVYVWEKVLLQMDGNLSIFHRCQGRCRGFSKKFYKAFILPVAADSVEDAYSFCFASNYGFITAYIPDAQINYRLPSTKNDFVKQTRRFVKGASNLSKFYGNDFVGKYMPTSRMKLKGLLQSLLKFPPHIIIGYIAMQLYARKTATMDNQRPIYEYVGSTKRL